MPGHYRQAPCIRVFGHLAVAALLAVPTLAGCHADDVAPLGVQGPGAALVVRGDSLLFLNDSAPYSAETPGTPDRGPREIDWSSSDSTIVSVGAQGIARARRIGTATLVATLTAPDLVAPMTRSFPVRVVYAGIAVDPVDSLTGLGERRTLLVRGLDVFGTPDATLPAVLASRDTAIVSVVAPGVIEARRAGITTVVARHGEQRDSIPVRVRRVAARLSFDVPDIVLPAVGRDTVVPLRVRDTNDSLIAAPPIRWTSSAPSIITVRADGTLRALRAGTATLTAQIDTVTATLEVSVNQVVADVGVHGGDGQVRAAGSSVPIPPSVVVQDAGGYPIAGAEVVFSVSEGDGAITDSIRTTDAEGIAVVGSWTLGSRPGTNRLLARVGGFVTGITATATIGPVDPATSQIVVARDSVTAGSTTVITLYARDALGNAITTGGAAVVFGVSGGTSAGQVGATADDHDGSYATTFAGRTAGSPTTVTATIDGNAVTSTRPTITVVAGAPTRLAVLVGDGQVATAGTRVAIAPVAGVFDALDNPVPGVPVTFAPIAGDGIVIGATRTTDERGHAAVTSWTLGSHTGEHRLTVAASALAATVTALATAGPVSPTTSAVSVSAGVVQAGSSAELTLQVRDSLNNPIGTGGAAVAFTIVGGTSTGQVGAVTDRGDGTYTATFTALKAGTPATVSASVDGVAVTTDRPTLTVVAASPARLSVLAGGGQVATVGTSVDVQPTVAVYDSLDNPVSDVPVSFTVAAGGGSVAGGSQETDTQGRARIEAWLLGRKAGENTLAVAAGRLSTSITATGVAGPASLAYSLVTVAGGDTLPAGSSTTITLRTYDQYVNPLHDGGLTVGFALSGGTSTGQLGTVVDNGDGSYQALFTGVGAGTPLTVGATINADAVTSSLPTITVAPGAPAQLALTAGDGQQATVGTPVPVAPTVAITDALGNPVVGAVVTFAITEGGGSVKGGSQVTDGAGRASVGGWTLGPAAGDNHLTAVAQAVRATFTATGTPGPVSPTASLVLVPQDTVAVGESIGVLLRTYDAYGNPARSGAVRVTFFLEDGTSGGTFAPAIVDRDDGTYFAAFTALTPGTPSLVRAVIDGVKVTTPSPSLTVRGAGTRWHEK